MYRKNKSGADVISDNQATFEDVCVSCGSPVPEGHMLCWRCEHTDYSSIESDDTDWDDVVFVWDNDYFST